MVMMLMKSILPFEEKLPHASPNIVKGVMHNVLKVYPVIPLFFHSSKVVVKV